jgi:hypothetical protein
MSHAWPLLAALLLQAEPDAEVGCPLAGDAATVLRNTSSIASCASSMNRWKRAHAFEKLALVEGLARGLKDDETLETPDYAWTEGTNDFRRLAGRISWALGELLGIRLVPIRPDSSAEELATRSQEALRLAAAYRAGLLAAAADRKEPAAEELKRKYAGRIRPGITDRSDRSAQAMHELLAEWFPIGKELRVLADIVGSPGGEEDGGIVYRFDSGYGGILFRLEARDGRIERLSLHGLE